MKELLTLGSASLVFALLLSQQGFFLRMRLLRRNHESRCLCSDCYSNWLDPRALCDATKGQAGFEFNKRCGTDGTKDYWRFQERGRERQEGSFARGQRQNFQPSDGS